MKPPFNPSLGPSRQASELCDLHRSRVQRWALSFRQGSTAFPWIGMAGQCNTSNFHSVRNKRTEKIKKRRTTGRSQKAKWVHKVRHYINKQGDKQEEQLTKHSVSSASQKWHSWSIRSESLFASHGQDAVKFNTCATIGSGMWGTCHRAGISHFKKKRGGI